MFEAFGGEGRRIEEEKREMTDDVTRGAAGERGVGIGGLQDLGGIVVENEAEEIGEARGVFGVMAEELSCAIGPGGLFGGGVRD